LKIEIDDVEQRVVDYKRMIAANCDSWEVEEAQNHLPYYECLLEFLEERERIMNPIESSLGEKENSFYSLGYLRESGLLIPPPPPVASTTPSCNRDRGW
jgi:hypothetical protein